MRSYKQIIFIENDKRTKTLNKFRDLVENYFRRTEYDYNRDPILDSEGEELRKEINHLLSDVDFIVNASGTSTVIRYTPPPAIGGYIQDVNLLRNIFNLHLYQITPINVLDMIDVSLGVYQADRKNSIIRAINPFFWLYRIYKWIVKLPFMLLADAGFNSSKIEGSLAGKIFKLLYEIFLLFVAVLTALQILGYFDLIVNMKNLIDSIF